MHTMSYGNEREVEGGREGERERVCVGKGLPKFHLYEFFLTKPHFIEVIGSKEN